MAPLFPHHRSLYLAFILRCTEAQKQNKKAKTADFYIAGEGGLSSTCK